MREIKFRGKSIKDSKWYYGYFLVNQFGEYTICGKDFAFQVIPETVGQFTGLKDKYNFEIFEGDCLGDYEDEKWVIYGVVSFYDYNATYVLTGEDGFATDYETYDCSDWKLLTLIGNIYQHPKRNENIFKISQ